MVTSCTRETKIPDFKIQVSPLSEPQTGLIVHVAAPDITVRIVPDRPFSSDTKVECVLDDEPAIPCPNPWVIVGLTTTNHNIRVQVVKGRQLAMGAVLVSVERQI
jgi:hypothetical protein